MNKKLIIILAISVTITISSCKKFLEITPQETFTSEIATSSIDGLTKTVTGGFNQLQSGSLYGGGIVANCELLGDFVGADPIADYSLNQLRTRQMDANNAQSGGMWSAAYRAIYIANVVLKALPNFQAQNAAQCQLLKGECLFIRGAMHFELVRAFALPSGATQDDSQMGVCIELTPGAVNQGQNVPRSTVAQCYAQIEADLDSAASLLPDAPNNAGNVILVTKSAAEAFLMRVYFTQHNYSLALNWANAVAGSANAFGLDDSVTTIFNLTGQTTDSGTIFQMISTYPLNLTNGTLIGRFKWFPLAPAQCYMSQYFDPYYEADSAAGGHRWKDLYRRAPDGQGTGIYHYWCQKYNNANMNITVLRYAEVLLTRAECYIQTNNNVTAAKTDLNYLLVHRGLLPDNITTDPAAILNEIRADRDFELAAEGDRFYEIKRRQINFFSPESGQEFAWNSPALIFPIPLQEIQENKNMVQNPGY